jgi:hypothetical protein
VSDAAGHAAPLGYAGPETNRLNVGLYRIALLCWLVPLVVGVATLALYAWTFWEWLPEFGWLTLGGGTILLVAGLICISVFRMGVRRCDPNIRDAWLSRANRATTLLNSNVLVALGCAFAGLALMEYFPVTLVNQTNEPITDITINATGGIAELKRLEPGQTRRLLVQPKGEGGVMFTATQNGSGITGVAAGYVSAASGGRSRVTFTNAGPVVITNR